MSKPKKYYITCPSCKTPLVVNVEREVITEAVKGEYEDVVSVKKDNQVKLA